MGGLLHARPCPHPLTPCSFFACSAALNSRPQSDDALLAHLTSSQGGALPAALDSRGSLGSGASGASEPRSPPGSDVQPWLLRFDELRIVRPIGEGSFGKARMVPGQLGRRLRACCGPVPRP